VEYMSRWVYPLMEVGNMKGSCLKFPIVDPAAVREVVENQQKW